MVEAVSLTLSRMDAESLNVPSLAGLTITLNVNIAWLRTPVGLSPENTHSVETSRASDESSPSVTMATLWGSRVDVTLWESLPKSYDLVRIGLVLPQADALELDDYVFGVAEDAAPLHQFLGYPAPIQGDVHESMASDLRNLGDDRRIQQLKDLSYRLLFQVEEDPNHGVQIADLGRLYGLIPDGDLSAGRFDRTLACVDGS